MAIREIGTSSNATTSASAGDSLVHSIGSTIMTNGDFSALEEFVDFTVKPGAAPVYGPTVPLKIALTGTLWHRGGGVMYVEADNSGAGSATNLIAALQNLGLAQMFLTDGTFTSVHNRSRTEIAAGATVPNLYQGGGHSRIRYKSGANNLSGRMVVEGGTVDCERGLSGSNVHLITGGARVKFWREDPTGDLSSLDEPTITNGTLVVAGSGSKTTVLEWQGGNIATIIAAGNVSIDFRKAPVDGTVTSLIWSAQAKAQSFVDPNQVDADITLNDTEVIGLATDYAANVGGGGNG